MLAFQQFQKHISTGLLQRNLTSLTSTCQGTDPGERRSGPHSVQPERRQRSRPVNGSMQLHRPHGMSALTPGSGERGIGGQRLAPQHIPKLPARPPTRFRQDLGGDPLSDLAIQRGQNVGEDLSVP